MAGILGKWRCIWSRKRTVFRGRRQYRLQQQTLEYNGTEKKDEVIELKLSDAFVHPVEAGEFEWTVKVININTGNNNSLISKCKVLKEYVILTSRMREYISKYSGKDFSDEEAVKKFVKRGYQTNL